MKTARQNTSAPDGQTVVLERMAAAFADLGNATRLGLLVRLAAGPKTVTELAAKAAVKPPTVSLHLSRLHATGWLHRVRTGIRVRYALRDDAVRRVVAHAAELARRRVTRPSGGWAGTPAGDGLPPEAHSRFSHDSCHRARH